MLVTSRSLPYQIKTPASGYAGPRFTSIIPILTTNGVDGYTATASATFVNGNVWQPWHAFSGYPGNGGASGGWLGNQTLAVNPNQFLYVSVPQPIYVNRIAICHMRADQGCFEVMYVDVDQTRFTMSLPVGYTTNNPNNVYILDTGGIMCSSFIQFTPLQVRNNTRPYVHDIMVD